jgi:hypothetical protein
MFKHLRWHIPAFNENLFKIRFTYLLFLQCYSDIHIHPVPKHTNVRSVESFLFMIWCDMIRYMIWYIFNRNWVDTRWQQYSTHLHANSTRNTENGTYITIKKLNIHKKKYLIVMISYMRNFHSLLSSEIPVDLKGRTNGPCNYCRSLA